MLPKQRKIMATGLILGAVFAPYVLEILDVRVWNPTLHGPWSLFVANNITQIIISWEIETERYGAIRFGNESTQLIEFSVDSEARSLVHLVLLNLEENSTYYYQIGYVNSLVSADISVFQPLSTEVYQFTTASSSPSQSTRFLAISDTQQIGAGSGFSRKMGNYLAQIAGQVDFISVIGDLTENGGQQSYWNDWFDFSSAYLGRTVFVPVTGNHDTGYPSPIPPDQMLFRKYFPISQSNNHFFYSFNHTQLHMVVADFTWPSDSEFSTEQLTWLENDLQAAQSMPFIVVAFHCPIHDSGPFGQNPMMQEQLRPILDYHNVTVILNGHDHHYERVEEFGLTYIILGGGGAIQDPLITPIPESKKIALGPNYAEFETNTTHLNMQIYSLQGEVIDSVSFCSRLSGGCT